MKSSFSKIIFGFTMFLFFTTFTTYAASGETENKKSSNHSFIKSYRFAGGLCYINRKTFEPDMVTFITTMPEFINAKNIEACLGNLITKKWKATEPRDPAVVNSLREYRTGNMSCIHVGLPQSPMMYQVRFSDFSLTNKEEELTECMAGSAKSRDLVIPVTPQLQNMSVSL